MVSDQECKPQAEGKFWPQEEEKAGKNSLYNVLAAKRI
jgi:hypothetical protein